MKIKQALTWATTKLKSSTSPSLDAEVLLSYILNQSKEFLLTHPEMNIGWLQKIRFKKIINKRSTGVPVAYLIHSKEFYGRDFYVDSQVLIPRPETELIIEEIKKIVKSELTIADIGTGSGCIAITLAKELPQTKILATDISAKALQVAQTNAKNLGANVNFTQGDLLEPIKDKKIDILVANLPYGWKQWKNNTSAETISLQFEPKISLFTKDDGLYLYKRLFDQVAKLKYKPKFILGEFDPRQTEKITKIIIKYFPTAQIQIKKDLADLDRLLIIKLS